MLEDVRAIVVAFWASPGPGVARDGFSAKSDRLFRGRHSNPCRGDPVRGLFSFLKVTPKICKGLCVCGLFFTKLEYSMFLKKEEE